MLWAGKHQLRPDGYFNSQQIDKVQEQVDALCLEIRHVASESSLKVHVWHPLTISPVDRLVCSERSYRQLAPGQMGWFGLRILLCPSASIQPSTQDTPVL